MKVMRLLLGSAIVIFASSNEMFAATINTPPSVVTGPEAGGRTYAQNYKDMLLVSCIARAYKDDPIAGKDAGYSAGVFVDWTLYDVENSSTAIDGLIERYLARDYQNPLVEYQGVQFNMLKCLDMYHSKELHAQVKKFVPKPNRTFRQDYPRHKF